MSLREMFRAMQQGRGWLTDTEISSRIVELQLGAIPDWDGELVELLRVMEARVRHHGQARTEYSEEFEPDVLGEPVY